MPPRATGHEGRGPVPTPLRRHERTLLKCGSRLLGTRPQSGSSRVGGPGPAPHLRFAGIGELGPAPAAPDLPESGTWPRHRPTRTPVPDSNLPAGGGVRVGIGEFAEKGPGPAPVRVVGYTSGGLQPATSGANAESGAPRPRPEGKAGSSAAGWITMQAQAACQCGHLPQRRALPLHWQVESMHPLLS